MLKSVLVAGKSGQLGQSIHKIASAYPQFEFIFTGREELDFSSAESMTTFFRDKHFDVIINCIAYTSVDQAESDPALADQVNHLAVKKLAELAKAQCAFLIHVSTDYVFNGQNFKPYIENNPVDPLGVYGHSKLKGERAVQAVNPHGCIIRTSWLYSEFGNNFVKTMLRLGQARDSLDVIFDQVGSPTYAEDLARMILRVAHVIVVEARQSIQLEDDSCNQRLVDVYHFSNEGVCSWYDFAKAIFELSGTQCSVMPIETKDYPVPATRPHYSVMNKAKIKQAFALDIPYWRDSLRSCLNQIEQNDNYDKAD
ncbi:dTDP-4-dehydrorhamnose reductase [Thiomicrorhabdus sp. 6S3-12]|nr:dTDP-4-dehydrorhamnose reductase [Thiomicrorhabdus sp. 6S3-12]MBO1922997.1 dTDP-4-dehydrorhamnose reductase [Thiomicrorhabdus sp. 6S3-12]